MAAAATVAAAAATNRVLVTGASGFIGAHVTGLLLKAGWTVRATVRDPTNEKKTAPLRALPGAAERLELVKADLLQPTEEWKPIVDGCTYVLHTASPFPLSDPKDKSEVIEPAVKGATSVVQASLDVASVRRVVLTSSCVSIAYGHAEGMGARTWTHEDWTDVDGPGVNAYAQSKTLAEKAAWDLVGSQPKGRDLQLATINPSFVQGPMLSRSHCSSVDLIGQILLGKMPGLPNAYMSTVDVRDVAEAHVRAMVVPDAAGKRFPCAATEYSFPELAGVVKEAYEPLGYKSVTSFQLPDFLVRFFGLFDKAAAAMVPVLGQHFRVDSSQTEEVLGMRLRDTRDSIKEMAASGIRAGLIPDQTADKRFSEGGSEAAIPAIDTDVTELGPRA